MGPECTEALQGLKKYISTPPLLSTPKLREELYLYLAVSEQAVSAVLIREVEKEQRPVYYVIKTLLDAETRYLPLEKLVYALLIASRKLQHYFQGHTINVLTKFLLRSVFSRVDFSGRTAKWAVELVEFDIRYQPKTVIKAQVLANFVTEFAPTQSTEYQNSCSIQVSRTTKLGEQCASEAWKLFIDTSNEEAIAQALDIAEGRRETTLFRLVAYQQQLIKSFNQKVFPRRFIHGELVLRKVMDHKRVPGEGKLGPNWEGPYKVTVVVENEAYYLEDIKGKAIPQPWNVVNLKKYYQ
ncbi:uncharacterized protein LOC114323039 [Camellia sinensis]|uniref:uncharacterized protein LOC114323039 n=1 Tax=Camellia sinensis TaxID=4442 RepID=UPI0010366E24|nr:uncharacterized protein LOC114323039 [Camellia sinensis]